MKKQSTWLWVLAGIIALALFGDEVLGLIGAVIGLIVSIGITGLVMVPLL